MYSIKGKDIEKARAVVPSLFCFIGFVLVAHILPAQKINPIVHLAYKDVLNLQFNQARDKLKFVHSNPENNPYSLYVGNLADVMEVYCTGSEVLFEKYKGMENVRLNQVSRLPGDKPEKYFIEAEIKIQWAFAKFKYGQYLKSFWGFKQAFSVAKKGNELFPDYQPLYKSLGVLHTVLGSFPENYHWLLSLMNADGNISLGMEELDKLNEKNSAFFPEAVAYKSLFQTFLLNEKEKSIEHMDEVVEENSAPEVMKVVAALVYFKSFEGQKSEDLLRQLEDKNALLTVPFLNYLLGEINLQKANYLTAIQYYLNFLYENKGTEYIKDTYLKIAICHWLNGDSNFKFYLDKARVEGKADIEADKNAAAISQQNSLPDKNLLKIRYATDGGFFTIVEDLFIQINPDSFYKPDEVVEYHYRMARYFHLTANFSQALKEYHWVIENQGGLPLYFAPNSCLQSAYIYIDRGNTKKAEELLSKAQTYNSHPYKSSIDKKAEIELNKLAPE